MADGLAPDGAGPQLYVLWEVLSGTPISGMLIDQADTPHLIDWLTGMSCPARRSAVLALLSDQEKALVAALRTVWRDARHQLCQMHFMQNLSEPVHREDQKMRQTLRDHLCALPSVPDLEAEEAAARIEHLVSKQTSGRKKEPDDASRAKTGGEPRVTLCASALSRVGRDPCARTGVVLQHFYGYYRRAIRDALGRSSRKPFQCGGLQGYDQLVGIDHHLQQRVRSSPDPYLAQLARAGSKRFESSTASQAEQVRQAHACLMRWSATWPQHLDPAKQSDYQRLMYPAQAARPYSGNWNRWSPIGATTRGPSAHAAASPQVEARCRRPGCQASCIAMTYRDCPAATWTWKARFGTLRRAQRRISGRKETTPIRIFGPGQIALLSLEDAEILPLLRSVPVDEYWSQRRRQEEREEPRRWLTRLHRDPVQALAQVDEQFYAVVNAQTGASSDAPDDP